LIFFETAKKTIGTVYTKQFDAGMKPEKVGPFHITVKWRRFLLCV